MTVDRLCSSLAGRLSLLATFFRINPVAFRPIIDRLIKQGIRDPHACLAHLCSICFQMVMG